MYTFVNKEQQTVPILLIHPTQYQQFISEEHNVKQIR